MKDIMRMEIGPIHGVCFDCRRWLNAPNSLRLCEHCQGIHNKALENLRSILPQKDEATE